MALSGDEDASPSLLAILSELWIKSPQDPEAMLEWNAMAVHHMMFYQRIKQQIQHELNKNRLAAE